MILIIHLRHGPDDWNEMFEIEELEGEATTTDIADLRAVQGTVLLHLTNMVRWEQSLGKSFLKMLKVTIFNMSTYC